MDTPDYPPDLIREAAANLATRIKHWQKVRPATNNEEFRQNFTQAVLDCAREDLKIIGRHSPTKMLEMLRQFPSHIQDWLQDDEIAAHIRRHSPPTPPHH